MTAAAAKTPMQIPVLASTTAVDDGVRPERTVAMPTQSRRVAFAILVMGTLVLASLIPSGAFAQCGMMGGGSGGHDHGAATTSSVTKSSGREKKLRRQIDQVMADEAGRAMLVEALLNDRAFVEELVRRMAAIPEWRSVAAQELGVAAPSVGGTVAPAVPGNERPLYVCPMHADVTSASPGSCPKCGMALVRKDQR